MSEIVQKRPTLNNRFSGLLNYQDLGVYTLLCMCCSAAIITAYLMRTEHLSQEGVNKSIVYLKFCRSTNWYMPLASSFIYNAFVGLLV